MKIKFTDFKSEYKFQKKGFHQALKNIGKNGFGLYQYDKNLI